MHGATVVILYDDPIEGAWRVVAVFEDKIASPEPTQENADHKM